LGAEQAGASAWNQLLVVRILAQSGEALRMLVRRVLNVLREGRAMPRVWGC
jgi:urease accessory protein